MIQRKHNTTNGYRSWAKENEIKSKHDNNNNIVHRMDFGIGEQGTVALPSTQYAVNTLFTAFIQCYSKQNIFVFAVDASLDLKIKLKTDRRSDICCLVVVLCRASLQNNTRCNMFARWFPIDV